MEACGASGFVGSFWRLSTAGFSVLGGGFSPLDFRALDSWALCSRVLEAVWDLVLCLLSC